MNRNSLFGRLRSKFAVNGTGRPESFRTQIEPLEDRKVLAVNLFVSNDWQEDIFSSGNPGTLDVGDTVFVGAITGLYGQTAFGRVTNTNVPFLAGFDKIGNALDFANDPSANTVNILQGTYTESDIVINKSHVILTGNGSSGVAQTLIVPEVASARAEQEFPVGSHSGIIVYATDVQVRNLRLNGGVNYDYHQGITTLYDSQGGVNGVGGTDYASIRDGNLIAPKRSTIATQHTVNPNQFVGTTVTSGGHGFTTAQAINFFHINGAGTIDDPVGALPAQITAGTTYFARVIDGNNFSVHPTALDATNNTNAINMTTPGAGGFNVVQGNFIGTNVFRTAHGFTTGQALWFYTTNENGTDQNFADDPTPGAMVSNVQYFARAIDANNFSLHPTALDATNNTNALTYTTRYLGTITALTSNAYGGIYESTGSLRPQIAYHDIVVDNAWYHGLTLSGPASMQFDEDNFDDADSPDNEIYNSVVNNVGDPSNRGENHIGILVMNVDSYRTGDPGGAPAIAPGGNVYNNIVNTAGIGIAGKVYGILSWNNDDQGRNDSTYSYNTVNTPVLEAYRLQDISGTEFISNFATFTNGVGIGIHTIHTDGSFLGNRMGTAVGVAAPLVGFKIENSNTGNQFGTGTTGHTIANTTLFGPGTGVANSVGILADNAFASNSDSSFLATYGTVITGWQKGVVSKQTVGSATPNTMYLDRMQVSGNATGFEFGSVGGGSVRIVGQVDTPDPISNLGGATMINGWVANLTEAYADGLAAQPVPPVLTPIAMTNLTGTSSGTTGSIVTVGAAYNWVTGQGLRINDTDTFFGHTMPTNIVRNQVYFIRSVTATTFTLHNSAADANANTNPITGIVMNAVGPINITELIATGRPGFNQPQYTITEATLSKPDRTTSGNLSLGAGTTYAPYLGGTAATTIVTLQNFNSTQSWGQFDTTDIDHVNPWAPGFVAKARLGFWGNGTVLQNGTSGFLRVADSSTGANFETGGAIQFTTTPTDVTEMGYLRVIMKLGAGTTTADEILVSVVDLDGTSDLHYFPTSQMDKTTFTTFYSNILTPPIRFIEGDNIANLSAIGGWAVSGAFGSTDGIADADKISLVVDDISYVPVPRASVYNVTGTVNISGAILQPLAVGINLWAASIGQTFTIIDNDAADAVTGTFAGLAQGATVKAGNSRYSISYTGGTGNDVVLTQISNSAIAPVADLNSGTGGINNTVNWTSPTPINIGTSGTVTDADDTTLYQMTATLTAPETGDVLAATGTANIVVSYNAGTGVLTMTGFDTLANYQTVLNSITYNKTGAAPAGNKTITVVANDGAGGPLSTGAVATVITSVGPGSSVVARNIFYNQSFFDGNSNLIQATVGGANNDDNDAIATDKTAYLPGAGTAVFANITSFSRGINGIMVDLSGTGHTGITLANVANNFVFKVGNNNTPSSWAAAPAPLAVSMTAGGGVSGSDRVTITWATGSINNKWLEVQVLAGGSSSTGLAATDVFFWGSRVADSGTSPSAGTFDTTTADASQVFANLGGGKPITDLRDYNRTGDVTTADASLVFGNLGSTTRLNVGTGGPFAPDGGGDAGIASALASTAVTPSVAPASLPSGIVNRLQGLNLNTGRIANFFQNLAEANTPGSRKILQKIGAVADDLGLEHDLLDDLLADLG